MSGPRLLRRSSLGSEDRSSTGSMDDQVRVSTTGADPTKSVVLSTKDVILTGVREYRKVSPINFFCPCTS